MISACSERWSTDHRLLPICANEQNIEGAEQFVYLGYINSADRSSEVEVVRCINTKKSPFVVS